MSAFQVSKKHIDVLVAARALNRFGMRSDERPSDDETGAMLLRENMRSLAARYPNDTPLDEMSEAAISTYRFDRGMLAQVTMRQISVVEIIKAIHCYEYQACEHDGWAGSDARRYCAELMQICTHALPGYAEAAWGIG